MRSPPHGFFNRFPINHRPIRPTCTVPAYVTPVYTLRSREQFRWYPRRVRERASLPPCKTRAAASIPTLKKIKKLKKRHTPRGGTGVCMYARAGHVRFPVRAREVGSVERAEAFSGPPRPPQMCARSISAVTLVDRVWILRLREPALDSRLSRVHSPRKPAPGRAALGTIKRAGFAIVSIAGRSPTY